MVEILQGRTTMAEASRSFEPLGFPGPSGNSNGLFPRPHHPTRAALLPKMVFDEGCVDEEDLRWLDLQGRHHHRHDFETNPIQAIMVCEWHERDYSLGGTTVFLTNPSMAKPLQPFDDDDDRSLMEDYCLTGVKRQWDVSHPLHKTERAVWVHVLFTLLMFAVAPT